MNAIIPYVFFIYMFIATWIIMMNYDKINEFSSSKKVCYGFISITIALFTFIGAATLYHFETKEDEYKVKIKDVCLDINQIWH